MKEELDPPIIVLNDSLHLIKKIDPQKTNKTVWAATVFLIKELAKKINTKKKKRLQSFMKREDGEKNSKIEEFLALFWREGLKNQKTS